MIKISKDIMDLALNKFKNKFKDKPINFVLLCSSGVDSISASYFFDKKYNTKSHPKLNMCLHFNHELRPQNHLMAKSYLNFIDDSRHDLISYSVVYLRNLIKKGTEEECHKARMNFLEKKMHYKIIISAHHLDDAVESYMLNILRGKEGYLPIPFITEIGNSLIVRPFLFTKKTDFIQYAEKNDLLKYVVEDETNKETKGSRRNFLRNEILPLMDREKVGLRKIVEKKLKERLMLEIIKG